VAAARTAFAVLFYYAATMVFRNHWRRETAFRILAVAAIIEVAVGIWEVFGGMPARRLLSVFKEQPTWFGNVVRAGGTFHYATVFSMFLEGSLPFALRLLGPMGLGVCLAGILFSSTRAGIAAAFAALAVLRAISPGPETGRQGMRTALAVTAMFALLWPERIVNRLPMREDLKRPELAPAVGYRFEGGPDPPLAVGPVGGTFRLRLQNLTGRPWPLGTRVTCQWFLLPSGRELEWAAFPLASEVASGGTARVAIPLKAPSRPGRYLLRFDVQLPSGRYLSSLGASPWTHEIELEESGPGRWTPAVRDPLFQPGRLTLWSLALRMWRDHPWIGAGPDSFRQLASLQLLAETGALGTAVFALLCFGLLRPALARRGISPHGIALAASIAAWIVHGLLDYFLWYFPLALLFWGTLGMLRACQEEA